jgi:hypothetical protein
MLENIPNGFEKPEVPKTDLEGSGNIFVLNLIG